MLKQERMFLPTFLYVSVQLTPTCPSSSLPQPKNMQFSYSKLPSGVNVSVCGFLNFINLACHHWYLVWGEPRPLRIYNGTIPTEDKRLSADELYVGGC